MRRHIVPALLVGSTLLVAFWIVASRQHSQPFKPFSLTSRDFEGCCPVIEGSSVTPLAVSAIDPAEPNIAAFRVESAVDPRAVQLGIRLVHGYNMPMCMRIKGYTVEEVVKLQGSQVAGGDNTNNSTTQQLDNRFPLQVWRVTSSTGEVELWVTTMIKADDFSVTRELVTSMAFPRVDVPDDPNWVPRGFIMDDFKHPVQSFKRWFQTRWNGARTDWLTFLRLRKPAWASEELLTYVSRSLPPSVPPANEPEVIRQVISGHKAMLKQLQAWRRATSRNAR